MESLSVVIITLNEEKNIGRCLDSIKDIADEIIVIDSFSTDQTQKICDSYGATFIQKEWLGYVETKNFAIQQSSFNLILSLDADESLTDKLKNSVKLVKDNRNKDGYILNRLTNYCGQWIYHSGWYPDKKLRLFDKTKGGWHGVDIHEFVKMGKDTKVGKLDGDLLHYSYYSISQHIRQAFTFSEISANSFYKQGKKVGLATVLLAPVFRFFRDYILKLGMLDGYYGFVICKISAHATFLKYVMLRDLWKKHNA